MIKTQGENNPVHYQQQKKTAVVPTNITSNPLDANVKNQGENNPVVFSAKPAPSRALNQTQGRSNQKFEIKGEGANNPQSRTPNVGANNSLLFLSIDADDQAEILAAEQEGVNTNFIYSPMVQYRNLLSDIIPTAGATESFAVTTGDFFYDPSDGTTGGPGGDCSTTSSGNTGDYPNCNCDTVTTLTGAGLSVEFLSFRVFGTFDYLNIYDGPDTSSPQIYDSNLNTDTDTLAGMIAANGSAVFTSTTGALTFEFHATSVVNTCGWEVEVLSAGGGGGGGTCSEENPNDFTFENGFNCSSASAFQTANDVTVAADENFTLENITASIFANGGIANVDVNYYDDAAGLPGALIGSEASVTIDNQTVIGSNFGFDVNEVEMTVTPFIFNGQAGASTKYWIELSVTDGGATGSVFWVVTSSTMVGDPSAQFDAGWGIPDPLMDGVYIWEGSCDPIGGGGCTPDSIETLYAGGNNGSQGGAVYFDITVGASDIEISTFDMNTAQTGPFTMEAYVFEGTYVGNQGNPAPWGAAAATGSGTGAGVGLPSTATLDTPITMSAGTTYAVALIFDSTHAHTYTNGDGTNQNYSNGDITLDLGSASNAPFTTPIFDPRVWNGGIGYCVDNGGGGTYDDCSGAIALACGDSVVGETLTATDSGGNAAPDVFYKFTGSGSPQLVTISLCGGGTDYDSVLRVFDDCNLANELAFNDDSCGLQSEVTFASDGTSTYYIMVEGFGSNSGNFSLDVTCTEPLPNDDCGGAIAVSCGDSVTGTTVGATVDSGAPVCGPAITSPGVWYTLDDTSGLPGDITLSLCNGTDFDSKISVYTGSCAALTCVVGNDDFCGLQSEVTFATDGNTKFYILIHSFGGATGNFTMDVTCMPTPPPNDMIVNSIDVDEIGFPYTDPSVAMPAATTEDGNPQGCDLTGANGVWYNFVAGGDGTANATIVTPGGASSVTFYTAPDENATETDLVLVPQNTNQCVPGTSASIFTLAGQAYYVFVLNTGAVTDIVIDGTNLGVSDNSIAGFSYYPNPTTGVLNLKSVDNIERVSLYNLLGQRVLDSRVGATATQLDLSGLSAGSYLMKVTVNGQTGTYKVLKD